MKAIRLMKWAQNKRLGISMGLCLAVWSFGPGTGMGRTE